VAKVGKFRKEGKDGIMERRKDGKIRQFENSAIRQLTDWKIGRLEK